MTCCSSLLLMYIWQSLLVCFGSLSCLSAILWRPTSRVPDWIASCCSIQWLAVWFNLTFTWGKFPALQSANTPSPTQWHILFQSLRLTWFGGGVRFFHQLFATLRTSYLIQRFRTLIRQSKGLYSTILLFSLWTKRQNPLFDRFSLFCCC